MLHEDPDLAQHLERNQVRGAGRAALARVISLPKAQFSPQERLPDGPGTFGMLVLEGLLLRAMSVATRPSLEVFGPGDVVRPSDQSDPGGVVPVEVTWWALTAARLAVLGPGFTRRMCDYPSVIAELAARLSRGSAAGCLRLSIVQQPRLSTRVHFMLWHLADRFGRVHSEGVVLPVPLCHGLVSWLVGAGRSAVCRAVNELQRERLIEHRPDGTWWLGHQVPEGFADLAFGVQAGAA